MDFWARSHEKKGEFTVLSAYRMLITIKLNREAWLKGQSSASDGSREQKAWTKLWQVKVPLKLKVFLWRLAQCSHHYHGWYPECKKHGLYYSYCAICGAADSWMHSLIQYTTTRCVWALSDSELVEHMLTTAERNVKYWIFSMRDYLSHAGFTKLVITISV